MTVVNRLERRVGPDQVVAHLEAAGGTAVTGLAELDVGVWRVERGDQPSWVARLLPPSRPFAWAEGDVEILRLLEDRGFPAERLAGPQSLAELDGHALVVTGHVDGVPRAARRETIRQLGGLRRLGDLLGRLTTLTDAGGAAARPGGGWHHLLDGTPDEEVTAAAELIDDAAWRVGDGSQADVDILRRAVDWIDGAGGLPEALIHPDYALPNVVAPPEEMVLVDWTGVGRGPGSGPWPGCCGPPGRSTCAGSRSSAAATAPTSGWSPKSSTGWPRWPRPGRSCSRCGHGGLVGRTWPARPGRWPRRWSWAPPWPSGPGPSCPAEAAARLPAEVAARLPAEAGPTGRRCPRRRRRQER